MKSKQITILIITFLTMSTFFSIIPSSSGELVLSESKIFDGLYANYTFGMGSKTPTGFIYELHSGDIYNVTWWQNASLPGIWQENLQTRLISNNIGFGTSFNNGAHTPVWVLTNISIGDMIPIAVDGIGDHTFNVSDEISASYPGYGNLDIWVLYDTFYPSNLVWYEKSTGLLLNGSFQWFGGFYNLTLTDTNMFSHYQPPPPSGIPGYSLAILLPIAVLMTYFILRKWKKNL
ncbi:MAG: hypothetical protein ACFFE5_14375 [Candidatus Thorarchaeota archaeon]